MEQSLSPHRYIKRDISHWFVAPSVANERFRGILFGSYCEKVPFNRSVEVFQVDSFINHIQVTHAGLFLEHMFQIDLAPIICPTPELENTLLFGGLGIQYFHF